MKLEQISVSNVGLLSGREKKKREIGMARKRAENREGSLGFPGFVKPVFTKDKTWALTLRDEEALEVFERKILRRILGGIQVNRSWRRRSNLELYKIYTQPDIAKFVKLQRLKWAGHMARMNEDCCCKKIFLSEPMGNRPQGKPPLRWTDCVEKDLNILKVKSWKTIAKSRDARRRLLEKARAVEPLKMISHCVLNTIRK
ncbi:putative endonuclease-reverse transcriptase [Trichonephila clavipes]|nr:putative endonuclease-reverse transcriptase [Trichonephila clavipes]